MRFVLLSNYRSGSTLMASLLNCHPEVFCDDEIFYRFIADAGCPRMLSPRLYLRGRAACSPKPVYGFDLKVDQLNKVNSERLHGPHLQTVAWLQRNQWRIVYLRRLNLFQQSLSNVLASTRRVWHRIDESPVPAVAILPKTLLEHMAYLEKTNAWEARAVMGLDYLELVYERDLLDASVHQKTADRVFAYLGLFSAPVKTEMRKMAASLPGLDVTNYEELKKEVRRSRYSCFVE